VEHVVGQTWARFIYLFFRILLIQPSGSYADWIHPLVIIFIYLFLLNIPLVIG